MNLNDLQEFVQGADTGQMNALIAAVAEKLDKLPVEQLGAEVLLKAMAAIDIAVARANSVGGKKWTRSEVIALLGGLRATGRKESWK